MYRVVAAKGEDRVKIAVDEMMCMVASRMKCGASFSGSSGSSPSEGFLGVERCGAGNVMGKLERREPRAGWAGMEPLWV